MRCHICNWTSHWIKHDMVDFVHQIPDASSPIFWHPFPVSSSMRVMFKTYTNMRISKEKASGGKMKNQKKSIKGKEKALESDDESMGASLSGPQDDIYMEF